MIRQIGINTLKALLVFLLASLACVCLITLFPLIGSLWTNNIKMGPIINDNFKLLKPISLTCLVLCPLFGCACYVVKKYRKLSLILLGVLGTWLTIIMVMYMQAGDSLEGEGVGVYVLVSFWALLAYSLYSIPIVIGTVLMLEKWTRHKIRSLPVVFEYNKNNGLPEANFVGKNEFKDFYAMADILKNRVGATFTEKVGDMDSFYWDFTYNEHKYTLHYNIYFGVVLFPDLEGKATTEEENKLRELIEVIQARY